MLPLILLLVLEHKIVAHNHKVAVIFRVLQGSSKDVTESIETRTSRALSIVSFDGRVGIKEFEEMHSLYDASNCIFFRNLITLVVAHVSSLKHTFDEKTIVLGHSTRESGTKVLDMTLKRLSRNFGKSPHAKLFDIADSISNRVI